VWKSDGTVTNTVMVLDINPAGDSISTYSNDDGVALNGEFVFPASDGAHDFELWKTDGTPQNIAMIFDTNPGGSSDPEYLTVVSGPLFFAADDGTHGPALWKSQGTASDTEMVADIYPGPSGDPYMRYLTESGGTIFFSARDDTHGQELWKTDGTVTGTVMVKDIEPSENGSPEQLIDGNGRLFFVADTYEHGKEVWVSDGTVTGTVLVKDIYSGEEDSSPYYLAEGNGFLFFQANDSVHGVELWKSDGTEEGTQMVADINPESADGDAGDEDMLYMNGTLFFYADDGIHGGELWALPWENISIEKTVAPATLVQPGTPITYSLAFRNSGFGTAVGVVITDEIPAELVDVRIDSSHALTPTGSVSYVWSVGDLAPGESGAITISGVVDPSEAANYSLTNQAIIYSTLGDLLQADNRSTVTNSVNCHAPTGVSLQRVPGGELSAGNTVRFMAEAQGDTPLAYAWVLDGSPVVESSSTFEHRFAAMGAYTVSVMVANVCGQGGDAITVDAQESLDQPDLSPSYKSVSLGNVEPGEGLTYSLILRNGSPFTATALV
jgi:uncharacterized repeat protein (TIGR01451 family)